MYETAEALRKAECHTRYTLSNVEYNREPHRAKHLAVGHLREQLADFVARGKVEEMRHDFFTEFRLSVVVMPFDELFRLIEMEARRLSSYAVRYEPEQFRADGGLKGDQPISFEQAVSPNGSPSRV